MTHASLYETLEGEPITLCGILEKDLPEGDSIEPNFLSHECDACWDHVGR